MKKFTIRTLLVSIGVFLLTVGHVRAAETNWKTIDTGTSKDFSGISCPDARTCFLVSGLYLSGGTGGIVKTSDGGEKFTLLSSPTSNPLHAISCPTKNTCYAVGDFGTFLKTVDGGVTWIETSLGNKSSPPQFTDVLALDAQKVMISGKDGIFFRSEDGGASWNRPTLRTVADLLDIYFLDGTTGFLSGSDGALFKTTDSGSTWTFVPVLRSAGQIVNIKGDGKSLLYAVGTTVNKSTDGGDTWTTLTVGANGMAKSYQAVAVLGVDTAYLLADLNTVFKTIDSGKTWQSDIVAGNTLLQDISCPGTAYCFAVGSSGKILRLGTPPAESLPPAPVVTPTATTSVQVPVIVVPTIPVVVEPKAVSVPASERVESKVTSSNASANTTFNRTLKKGAKGEDVKKLQKILAEMPDIYPEGDVSGFFGPATLRALRKFQEKYTLASSGESGYGQAGPKTRAKLLEVATGKTDSPDAPASTPKTVKASTASFTRTLKRGSKGDDVKKLQELLANDKEIYPDGEVSGIFGPATAKAVGRFQEKHEIAVPGDEGYGEVGPRTQKTLLEKAE